MDAIRTIELIEAKKSTYNNDFMPVLLYCYRKTCPSDWSVPDIDETKKFLALFGMSTATPNKVCDTVFHQNEEGRSYFRCLVNNHIDIVAPTDVFIPPFGSDFWSMVQHIVAARSPPLLKALGLFFVAVIYFRIQRLTKVRAAAIHSTIWSLSKTGNVGSDLLQHLAMEGHAVESAYPECSTGLSNMPDFSSNPEDALRQCFKYRRGKQDKGDETLTDESIEALIGEFTDSTQLNLMETMKVGYYYKQFLLSTDTSVEVNATAPEGTSNGGMDGGETMAETSDELDVEQTAAPKTRSGKKQAKPAKGSKKKKAKPAKGSKKTSEAPMTRSKKKAEVDKEAENNDNADPPQPSRPSRSRIQKRQMTLSPVMPSKRRRR